ncbi:30S ribosome-binding factor RbfA [bacterium]|nr:30S ribosome-binding factor RbfA [bacterium]
MSSSLRNERVRKELMREISEILRKEIRGLEGVVSITDVEVSHDNSFAKVFYSVFGSEEQKEKSVNIINQNVSKIRYEVGKRIRLRLTPELRFIQDNSIERGSRVNEILEKISRGEV